MPLTSLCHCQQQQRARRQYYGFGFAIPPTAVIHGIQVSLEGNRTSRPRTLYVDLTWDNATFSTAQNAGRHGGSGHHGNRRKRGRHSRLGRARLDGCRAQQHQLPGPVDPNRQRSSNLNLDQLQVRVYYNSPPNAPSSINQYKTDGTTVIPQGGYTGQTQVVFKATAIDPDPDQYQLEVEVVPNASAFTNTATCTSPLVNSGTEASTGLCGAFTDGTAYKWQYRLVDATAQATNWTAFGATDPDFTVDTTMPTVTNIDSTEASGTYGVAALLHINVTFSEAVTVSGTPQLTLETGGTDETANYSGGSGTSTLTFNYTVQPGDSTLAAAGGILDYVSASALALNGGSIRDAALNDATLTLPSPGATGSLGANKDIVINTASASVTNVTSTATDGAYTVGTLVPDPGHRDLQRRRERNRRPATDARDRDHR